ncbi:MAG: thiamine pyrophosphate-dependent enzyme, partial [Polaribacter sp.]|nr:thiamine pyrophosphate-dependent enzyme [Polaribacter sp.]
DIGDGQTIRQENVFENHILFSANLIEDSKDVTPSKFEKHNLKLISEALHIAISKKGPIHINVPFDEPLYETVNELQDVIANKVSQSLKEQITSSLTPPNNKIDFDKLSDIWNTATKKMILVGVHYPNEAIQNAINFFAEDESVIILTETTSNLHHKNCINAIDQLIFSLDDAQKKALHPEVLITFGGMVVSKRIKRFLRDHKPKHHWHIDTQKAVNTFHCLSEFIKVDPPKFLSELKEASIKTPTFLSGSSVFYQQKWLAIRAHKRIKHQEYLADLPHSDLKVFEQVFAGIPDNYQLQISNSSVIRYAQLFNLNTTLRVFCNRGTSGIDGSTSTAIGAAFVSQSPTVFVTGDLSFFYDSNALWNSAIKKNFRIIIINNASGGIFRIIPGPKNTNALDYFETPHNLTAEHLCKMHQFEYCFASSTAKLTSVLTSFYQEGNQPKILEIFTDKELNEQQLTTYFNFLK